MACWIAASIRASVCVGIAGPCICADGAEGVGGVCGGMLSGAFPIIAFAPPSVVPAGSAIPVGCAPGGNAYPAAFMASALLGPDGCAACVGCAVAPAPPIPLIMPG